MVSHRSFILAGVLAAAALLAGCADQEPVIDPFVGAWIGHGEATLTDTPSTGQTQVLVVDDVITFHADATFRLQQTFQQYQDGLLAASAHQRGTGAWSRTAGESGTLTMDFDASADPGLTDGAPTFSFSQDQCCCEIQPPTLPFPLSFQRVE